MKLLANENIPLDSVIYLRGQGFDKNKFLLLLLTKLIIEYFRFKSKTMLTKQTVLKSIENLPDHFSIDELIDQLIFVDKVEEGRKQSREGNVVSHEDVKNIIAKWSK